MKITFLGTSHGVPEANRKCTSIMLTVDGKHYIIDTGSALITSRMPLQVDLKAIRVVALTHMHGDHANGLIEFTDLITWHFKDVRPDIYLPEIKARNAIRGWLEVTHGRDVSADMPAMLEVTEGVFHDDGDVRMTAIRNRHLPDRPSYSYMIEAEGKRLIFTGDMGNDNYSDFPSAAYEDKCDLVVTEAAHCRLTDCMGVFSRLNTDRLIVSHIVPFNEPEVARLARRVNYPVTLAKDGFAIEL